jgi:uridine kinase
MERSQERTADIGAVAERIRKLLRPAPAHAVLAGISGIDASGKGWLSDQLANRLEAAGVRVALIHADGWLNLPDVRFGAERPGRHFYEHALRLDEMFESLIIPLVTQRNVRLEAAYAEETATEFRRHLWEYEDVDVVLVESIFLLKRAHRSLFDVAIWADCTFDTALERAIARGQEGLSAADTKRAYETIYFPAQRIHMERDDARNRADVVFGNDPRLTIFSVRGNISGGASRSRAEPTTPTTHPSSATQHPPLRAEGVAPWSVSESALLRAGGMKRASEFRYEVERVGISTVARALLSRKFEAAWFTWAGNGSAAEDAW